MKNLLFFFAALSLCHVIAQPNTALRQRLIQDNPATKVPMEKIAPSSQQVKQVYNPDSTGKSISPYHPHPDSAIRIGLLLPLDYPSSSGKIYGYMNDKELAKGDLYKLKETSRQALEFYQGLQYAINHSHSAQRIEFYTYDTENSDSTVQELLKLDALRNCHLIIGPSTPSEAKYVAAFCKKNKIINIQPFVASKSISSENPYLVRLMPTIDAHLQKEYEMVIDSFADKNIIVYTTRKDHDLAAARQLDTLFKSYNEINTTKLRYTLVNTGDSSVPAAHRSLSYHLHPKELNVVLMTCYEEPLVNSMLRTTKENTVIFGLPTWMDGEQIRADYLSNAQPYFTDNFYADTSKVAVTDFVRDYTEAYSQRPSRYAYMGYDAMNYLYLIFDKYGRYVSDGINRESYDGLGYSFHLSPMIKTSKTTPDVVINYYANTAMHLFQVRDYRVWLVK